MYVARRVFYVSTFGVVLAVVFRNRFDGVAFLFTVIAVMALVMNLYLETLQGQLNNERCYNDFD